MARGCLGHIILQGVSSTNKNLIKTNIRRIIQKNYKHGWAMRRGITERQLEGHAFHGLVLLLYGMLHDLQHAVDVLCRGVTCT